MKLMSALKSIENIWDRFEAGLTSGFDSFQKKLWNIFIFLLRFLVLAIPLHVLLWLNFDAHILQVVTVNSVSFLLSLFNVSHRVIDVFLIVYFGSVPWTIEIIKDCVGWKSFMAVCALIFAVRKVSAKKRIKGILIAAPLIFIGNIFRIFTSIYLSMALGYKWFDFIHNILWQWGLIALVILIWWLWLEKIADVGNRTKTKKKTRARRTKRRK